MRGLLLRSLLGITLFFSLIFAGCGGGAMRTNSGPWSYVALGDSLAAGLNANRGYVLRYADNIQRDTGVVVNVNNLGVSGWTSTDLLNAIRTNPAFRSAISNANVVTWDIGGNDLLGAYHLLLNGQCGVTDPLECFRIAVTTFETNWDAIVVEILALRGTQNTILRTMDVYNPFVAEQKTLGIFSEVKPFLDEVDAHIQASAQQNGIPCARIYAAFNGPAGDQDALAGGLISTDLLHPNDAGHTLIADQLSALGYAPLR